MPIRPENRHRYPKDWKHIRARILERAGNKCEWCGVPNYAVGYRDPDGTWHQLGACPDEAGLASDAAMEDGHKVVQIILTIAHVHDHAPENCADDNLAALCQRCHNRHDAPMRRRNAYMTRRKNGTAELAL